MDYTTEPLTREKLRIYAKMLRLLFGFSLHGRLPVLEMLEHVPEVFKGTVVDIVEDANMPTRIPARCVLGEDGCFTIQISEYIYIGAYERRIGAYLGIICHEICHIFLYRMGYMPKLNRNFDNKKIKTYCSMEWQAKALSGEVMLPYDETEGKSIKSLMEEYDVSQGFAKYRKRI